MAGWRLYLTDQTIRRLDIVPGKPALLAAWTRGGRVFFLDVSTGNQLGERLFEPTALADRAGDDWRAFVRDLAAPNGQTLPLLPLPGVTIHTTADNRVRLLQLADGSLWLDLDGTEARLDSGTDSPFVAAALDRQTGIAAALDSAGMLHVVRPRAEKAIHDLGIPVESDMPVALVVAGGAAAFFATNGKTLVRADTAGQITHRLDLHYEIGHVTCAPDGRWLALTDREIGVIRIYSGGDLRLNRQRFAADLLTEARRVQLLPGPPGLSSAMSALTLSNRGLLAFAVSGIVCVTSVSRMAMVPVL